MNTQRKPVVIKECTRCDRTYMTVGDAAIRLSQYRPAQLDPRTGQPQSGVCPGPHSGRYSEGRIMP